MPNFETAPDYFDIFERSEFYFFLIESYNSEMRSEYNVVKSTLFRKKEGFFLVTCDNDCFIFVLQLNFLK